MSQSTAVEVVTSDLWDPRRRLDRAVLGVTTGLGALVGVGFLLLMLLTIFDVALRHFTGRGIGGSVELTEVALAGLVYLGMSTAETGGNHVTTPIVTNRLPSRVGNIVRSLALAIATAFVAWLTGLSAIVAVESILDSEFRFALIMVPVWPARIAITLGLAALALVLAIETLRTIQRAVSGEKLIIRDLQDIS